VSEAAACSETAPEDETDGDDGAPAVNIGEAADGDSEEGVEEGEAEAHEQAHLRVGNGEVAAQRRDEQRENLAVDEREDVNQSKDCDYVPGVAK
jgi:hypothetical protein